MWIKICGVQRAARARTLARMDINALGINRYEPSSRYVTRNKAVELTEAIRSVVDSIDVVGVYVNPDQAALRKDQQVIDWDVIQLHGDESPGFVDEVSRLTRVMKAFSVDEDFSRDRLEPYDSWAYLLDAYHPDQYGGTGRTIAWSSVKDLIEENRIVLSGGLTPDNIQDAIETTRPYGVDACSGIEDEEGLKDTDRSEVFVMRVREITID
jgi:phosphoribosylanthranilate isomerase